MDRSNASECTGSLASISPSRARIWSVTCSADPLRSGPGRACGHAFTARSIQVFRIRDGKILLFRDYANPNALAEALGA